jgi:glycosyltransferase involved in cell wall biosynthesis
MAHQVGPLKIRGWAQGDAGSGMYRIDLPMWALRKAGHEAISIVGYDNAPDDTDVVVGQVVADPGRHELWKLVSQRPGRRPVLVFELDDDLWNVHKSNVGGASFAERDSEILRIAEKSIAVADAVTVSTPRLAEVVRQFNDHVYVVPNCIDANVLVHERNVPDRPTFGWTVSSSHLMDVEHFAGTFSHYLRRHPDADLHFIGGDFRPWLKAENTRWTNWNAELTDYWESIDFHVGIAPLMVHPFNKARSDVKALEYAALGIPVIASNYGPYPESIRHGETGLLVKQDHEWAKHLNTLLYDTETRARMSANAKDWASERTIQGNVWRWEEVFAETIERVHGSVAALVPPPPQVEKSPAVEERATGVRLETPVASSGLATAEASSTPVEPMRVEAWAAWYNASAQYRVALPSWGLEQRGHTVRAFAGPNATVDDTADLVLAQCVVHDYRLDQLKSLKAKDGGRPAIVVELDDDYWNIHDSNTEVTWMKSPETLAVVEDGLRVADAVTVTTEALAHKARQFNEHVYVLPNCVDLNLLLHEKPEPKKLTVGWAGSNSHYIDFASIKGGLDRVISTRPALDWHFIGVDYRPLIGLTRGRYTPGVDNLVQYLETIDFHIGIAPLANDVFNLSKSNIRILEYSALGIPVVASAVGEYGKAIEHGHNGLLVNRPSEWSEHVMHLAEDEQARRLMGVDAKIWASERTIQGNAWRWEKAFSETLQRVRAMVNA